MVSPRDPVPQGRPGRANGSGTALSLSPSAARPRRCHRALLGPVARPHRCHRAPLGPRPPPLLRTGKGNAVLRGVCCLRGSEAGQRRAEQLCLGLLGVRTGIELRTGLGAN